MSVAPGELPTATPPLNHNSQPARIAVVGMGYVGCVTAACLSRDGHTVVGVDVDEHKVAALQEGAAPVAEPGLDDLLHTQVQAGRLAATCNLDEAVCGSDLAMVTVGTPSAADGSVTSVAVERVVAGLGELLAGSDRDYTIVVRSTLLPGILEDRLAPILESAAGESLGPRLRLCNHPEFLRETTAIRDYDDPPFLLVGSDEAETAESVFGLYNGSTAKRLHVDTRTAALVKYACNAFHALKIDFANEIGTLAKSFGADGREVMRIVCEDDHLNLSAAYMRPGFAYGGSCLPKDVRALTRYAQTEAVDVRLLSALEPANEAHLQRAIQLVQSTGCQRLGIIGLSFKAGTDDLRESPQVRLAETLLGRGYDLRIYDPGVRMANLVGTNLAYVDRRLPHLASLLVDDPQELYAHAELLVVCTSIADELDWEQAYFGEVVDLRRDLVVPQENMIPV